MPPWLLRMFIASKNYWTEPCSCCAVCIYRYQREETEGLNSNLYRCFTLCSCALMCKVRDVRDGKTWNWLWLCSDFFVFLFYFFLPHFMIVHGNLSAICLPCKGLSSCHEGTYLAKWGSLLMSTTHPWGSVLMCSNYEIKETKSGWKELEATCGEWTHNLNILQCPSSFFRLLSSHLTKVRPSFHFPAFVVSGCKTALLWL